jgi:hypothetical protein
MDHNIICPDLQMVRVLDVDIHLGSVMKTWLVYNCQVHKQNLITPSKLTLIQSLVFLLLLVTRLPELWWYQNLDGLGWLTPVIPTKPEVDIRRIKVQGQRGHKAHETPPS